MAKAKKAKKARQRTKSAPTTLSTSAGKTVSTTIRLDPERHDRLRTVAFHARRSMHSLLVEGVDLMLAKHKG